MSTHRPGCRPLDIDIPDPTSQCHQCLTYTTRVLCWALADLIVWHALDRGDPTTMIRAVRQAAEQAIEVGTANAADLGVLPQQGRAA